MKKNHGFTLAEILIVLTVIGVIAAITVPSVSKSVKEQQNKTKLKKAYNTVFGTYNIADLKRQGGNKFSLKDFLNDAKDTWCLRNTGYGSSYWLITPDGIAYAMCNHYFTQENYMCPRNAKWSCQSVSDIESAYSQEEAFDRACDVVVVDLNGYQTDPNSFDSSAFGPAALDRYYIFVGRDGITTGPNYNPATGMLKD